MLHMPEAWIKPGWLRGVAVVLTTTPSDPLYPYHMLNRTKNCEGWHLGLNQAAIKPGFYQLIKCLAMKISGRGRHEYTSGQQGCAGLLRGISPPQETSISAGKLEVFPAKAYFSKEATKNNHKQQALCHYWRRVKNTIPLYTRKSDALPAKSSAIFLSCY